MSPGFREHPRGVIHGRWHRFPLERQPAACRYAPGLLSNSASGPEEERFFDHHTFCIGHNLRMSPVTDHMLQSGLKFEVSAKTLTREKQKANLN